MNENYLYILPKSNIEDFVNNLEENRSNSDITYQATYMSTKNSNVQEVVDARTRLAAIENKEAIDSLTSRVATMESLVNAPEYQEVGKTFVHDGRLMGCGHACTGNGYTAYTGYYLAYSTDGKKFTYIDTSLGGIPEGMTCVGFEYEDRMFRYSQMLFADGLFFIYLPNVFEQSPLLVSTSDFKTFTKVEGFGDEDLSYAILLPDEVEFPDEGDNTVKFIVGNKVYQLSANGPTLLGTMNISLDIDYLDIKEVLSKFQGNYYGISNGKLYKSSDMLTYTEVPVVVDNKTFNDIQRFNIIRGKATPLQEEGYTREDILIVSSNSKAAYTSEGTYWHNIEIPTFAEDGYIFCESPIDIKKIQDRNLNDAYYAIIQQDSSDNACIYKWSSLSDTPTCFYRVREDGSNGISLSLENNIIKEVNGIIYFIDKYGTHGNLYALSEDCISRITPLTIAPMALYTNPFTSILGYDAFYGRSKTPACIFDVNGYLYITSGTSNVCFKQIPVYAPA